MTSTDATRGARTDLPPLLTRTFLLLTAAHLLQALAYASMLLLPLYLDHLGATRAQIGGVMGAAAIGGLALRPVVGWALDALGRKPTLVAGTLISVTGMGLLWFVHDVGPLVYAARVVFGIGTGAMFSGYFTLAADIIPESRRTEGIAIFGVSGLLPLAVNPLAGEIGIAPVDVRWFLPVVGIAVLASLLCLARVPAPALVRSSQPTGLRGAARDLTGPGLRPVWLATIVFSGLVALFFAFGSVAAENRGIARPAGLWLTYAGGAATIRILGARLPDRLGPANIVAPALACYVAGALAIAAATTSGDFLLAGLLGGVGHGYCFPVLTSQVVTRTPAHRRGAALASFTALWDATSLVLPPLYGLFGDRFGDSAMFSLAGVLTVVALAAWALAEHRLAPAAGARRAA